MFYLVVRVIINSVLVREIAFVVVAAEIKSFWLASVVTTGL